MQLQSYSCTKSGHQAEFGAQEGHFLHRKLWRVEFGVKKGVFLHQMLLLGRVWCAGRAFPAPEVVTQTVRRKKECFPAQNVAPGQSLVRRRGISCTGVVAGGVRRQKECFPAPNVAPGQSLVRRRGIFCTGSCREENTLQQLSGAEEVYGWEYECGAGQKEYQSIGHRYAVGFEEQGCLWVNCPKKNAYCCPQQHHNCHSC